MLTGIDGAIYVSSYKLFRRICHIQKRTQTNVKIIHETVCENMLLDTSTMLERPIKRIYKKKSGRSNNHFKGNIKNCQTE